MSAERGGLPYLFGIAEVIAITSGTEEDLEWAAKFREARSAVASAIDALEQLHALCLANGIDSHEMDLAADALARVGGAS